jgi:hypothetical protein
MYKTAAAATATATPTATTVIAATFDAVTSSNPQPFWDAESLQCKPIQPAPVVHEQLSLM